MIYQWEIIRYFRKKYYIRYDSDSRSVMKGEIAFWVERQIK